ncbi:MAG: MauE/DoxX family redox-associated membrane protein [Acidimicrobiales bacterium]
MATLVMAVRLALATVFAAASIGKLLTAQGTDLLLETFQLSPRLRPAVNALPALELAVAGTLVFPQTSRVAAAASCLLLAVFCALVARAMHRGLTGSCNCFGRLHSSKIGWSTIVRNIILASASAFIVVAPSQPRSSSLVNVLNTPGRDIWSLVALGVVSGSLVASFVRGRSRQHRPPTEAGVFDAGAGAFARRHRPPLDPASSEVVSLDGRVTTLADRLDPDGRNTLVFVDPACGPCRSLLPDLQSSWPYMTDRLVLVTRGPLELNRELLAGFPEDRCVVDDDDKLMIRYGVLATPSAVVLSASHARPEALVVGPEAIRSLTSQSAGRPGAPASGISGVGPNEPSRRVPDGTLSPLTSSLQAMWSRRETLTAGLSAGVLAPLLTRLGRAFDLPAKLISTTSNGVQCPTCGTCMICEEPAAGSRPKELVCRPCKQKCTANDLCVNYANKLPAYTSISAYLVAQGFSQSGEPTALGLQQNGTLSFIGTNTGFTSKSPASPNALLMYTLTNTGGIASAAILNSDNKITSVVATNSAGQVVAIDVPLNPSLASSTAARATSVAPGALRPSDMSPELRRADAGNEPASCEEVCSTALALMIGVLTPLAAAGEAASITTIKLALPLLKGILSAAIGGGSETDLALTTMGAAYTGASLLNLGEESAFSADVAKDKVTSTAEQLICSTLVCNVKLEGCCNYTGACYDLDTVCERNCPGGLKHPLAHCDVYLTRLGKKIKISTLVPGL